MAIQTHQPDRIVTRAPGRGWLLRAAAALALSAAAASAWAADFPQRSIQLILSFPPGGATDVLARELPREQRDAVYPRIVEQAPGFGGYQEKTTRIIPVIELQRR